jgi:hypothetical protein
MALGPIVAGPYRPSAPFRHCTRRYVDQLLVYPATPEAELAYSGQRLIPIKSLCLEDAIRSACAMGSHASVGGGLQLSQKTTEAEVD